jgi:predicted nucleic acid-binding protein
VAEVWVVNASPLISLERIAHVHLLAASAAEVILPEGVITEVGRGPKPLVGTALGAHRVVHVEEIHPTVAAWDLGLR